MGGHQVDFEFSSYLSLSELQGRVGSLSYVAKDVDDKVLFAKELEQAFKDHSISLRTEISYTTKVYYWTTS